MQYLGRPKLIPFFLPLSFVLAHFTHFCYYKFIFSDAISGAWQIISDWIRQGQQSCLSRLINEPVTFGRVERQKNSSALLLPQDIVRRLLC